MRVLSYLEYWFRPVPGYTLVAQPVVEALSVRAWRKSRKPPPPRSVKASVIREHAASRPTLIETGTFYGDTLALLENHFGRLYSIEVSARLAHRATRRFRGNPRVTIIHGDSATSLEAVLAQVDGPVVLWLDAHYSGVLTGQGQDGSTPVLSELDVALRHGTQDDAILIDDARIFGNDPAYPTIAAVTERIHRARPDWSVRVEDDVIRAHGR